jgi:hypothetical protein
MTGGHRHGGLLAGASGQLAPGLTEALVSGADSHLHRILDATRVPAYMLMTVFVRP